MKDKTILGLVGLLILGALVFYVMISSNDPSNLATIQSQGTYQTTVTPDLARVWVGVSILKPTAKEAQDEENRVIQNIIDGLVAQGISRSDIETESINLYEEMSYSPYDSIMPPKGTEKSKGWRATQNLKVKTSDFTKVGSIVDVSVNNGANQINNVEFYLSSSKENEYRKTAIEEATKNARDKAQAMASGSGSKLGKVKSISENQYYATPYMYGMKNNIADSVEMQAAAVREAAVIVPQSVTVTANVNVMYQIN